MRSVVLMLRYSNGGRVDLTGQANEAIDNPTGLGPTSTNDSLVFAGTEPTDKKPDPEAGS